MIETLRSIVHPWECDAVEHFTTAYYFRTFSHASWHLLHSCGYDESDYAMLAPVSCRTRFIRELRANDPYHLESGLIAQDANAITVGHRLFNSETNALCATFELLLTSVPQPVEVPIAIDWDIEAPANVIDFDKVSQWFTTSCSVVQSTDIDLSGRFDLNSLIHHASDANVQFQNMLGMTSSYMHKKKIGFSTAEYQIEFGALPATSGTIIETRSGLAHIGRTSLWVAHQVRDRISGALVANLSQFGVHLDRVARKASPIPDSIRETMKAMRA